MIYETLNLLLSQNNFQLTEDQSKKLVGLIQLFQKWNKVINLSSHKTAEDIIVKDICDALYLNQLLGEKGMECKSILDLGCGGGLIGLTLSIIGRKTITFLDSDRKKINFIREAMRSFKLKLCTCLNTRIEDFDSKDVHIDLIMTRATWNLKEYLNHVQNYVHFNGYAVLLGSQEQADREVPPLEKENEIFLLKYNTLPGMLKRCLIISKIRK